MSKRLPIEYDSEMETTIIELTQDQRQAILNGEPVRVASGKLGGEIVLVQAGLFDTLQELLEDRREKQAWAELARKAATRWAQENPF